MSDAHIAEAVSCSVTHAEMASFDVRILKLSPDPGRTLFDWRAGQYARFRIADFEPRDYSIANAPGDGDVELHVRKSHAGGLSDYICGEVKVGDTVSVAGAFGGAYFRAGHGGPLLAIAGGTGLAPMKAVVEAALRSDLSQDVHLYFGVNSAEELYLERYFIGLMRDYSNFRFVTVINDPDDSSGRRLGMVGDAVAADFQLLYGHQCYLAGPPAMAEACRTMLKLKSVPNHDMFCDAFYATGSNV